MSLDIPDFGLPQQPPPDKEEVSKEELEKFYQSQINQLKKQYEKQIQEAYQKGLAEGKKQGEEEATERLNKQCEEQINQLLAQKDKELKERINSLQNSIQETLSQIEDRYNKRLTALKETVLSAIPEIMEYLFINPSNAQYVSDQIQKLLEDLGETEVVVEVSPQVAQLLETTQGIKVVENPQLQVGDFKVKIENAQIEANFKEKLGIILDEIKREIKKTAQI
ncbi:MAG: hypothetical protein GXO45_01360 [Aquificae bacterium]|nr:hypothetical protein [Aquificota bacterium]